MKIAGSSNGLYGVLSYWFGFESNMLGRIMVMYAPK